MGIIGSPIQGYVSKQIEIRQTALADGLNLGGEEGARNIEDLQAFNQATPWMRLASAVKISNGDETKPGVSALQQIKNSGLLAGIPDSSILGNELAKNFVLQGAPNSFTGKNPVAGAVNVQQLYGPVQDSLDSLKSAYGFGYGKSEINSERGYVPPPGVTNVEFEYKNDGALAFATVKIKAFSATQFAMIDLLYMRPGMTCLLEFGHTQYLGGDGKLKSIDSSDTLPLGYLFNEKKKEPSYSTMARTIQNQKLKSDGNYEGFFGRITKFSWKFNSDGSYDIDVKLTGTGDVISSLKANIGKTTKKPASFKSDTEYDFSDVEAAAEDAEEEGKASILIANANSSQLNFEMYALFQDPNLATEEEPLNLKFTDIPIRGKLVDFTALGAMVKFDVNDWGGTTYSPITSIKFAAFLTILQKICNLTDGKSNTLLNFEIVEDFYDWYNSTSILQGKSRRKNDSFMVTYPGNFSSNPNICLTKYSDFDQNMFEKNGSLEKPQLVLNTKIRDAIKDVVKIDEASRSKLQNKHLAYPLGDVYVDLNFIAGVMDDIIGEPDASKAATADIPVLDLINGVLGGINNSLGNINNFRVLFNETTSRIDIISESPILAPKDTNKKLTIINTFGLSKLEGSFVTDLDLNSELSDAMATQISIGAQANGNQSMSNSTSFSTYNKGLEDSLMLKKLSTISKNPKEEEQKDPLVKQWDESDGVTCFDQVYDDREFDPESGYIPGLESITSTFSPGMIGRYTNKGNSSVPFFLPFNMGITMKGLGGLRIYDGFAINGKGLPPQYNPSDIKLVIKSLSHTVSLDGWKTKISTISFPISKVTESAGGGEGRASTGEGFTPGGAESGDKSNYTTPGVTGKFDIDLTRTLNSPSRMKIVNAFGWPVTVQSRGGKTYGKKKGDNNGRVVYEIDQAYKTKNNKPFTYTFKNGEKYTSKSLHQGIHSPLKKSFAALDKAGIGKAGIKNLSASVYARDTTNAPGLLSGHSFGVAMDFNSDKYQYGNAAYETYTKDLKNKNSANHQYAKAIDVLQKTGLWVWGGNYSKTKDAHHFTFKPYSS